MTVILTPQTIVVSIATLFALYKGVCWVLDRYQIGEKRKEYALMREANQALMREVIRTAHKESIAAGAIDEDELEHIENVYAIYSALGGNGTGARWMDELRNLPRRA